MGPEAVIVLLLIAVMLGLLAFTQLPTDMVFLGTLLLFMIIPIHTDSGWQMGIISPEEAFSGFGNSGMITVGFLFIVVAGLQQTGGIDWIAQTLMGRPTNLRVALARITLPVVGVSAFLNNTPVVAMFIPVVHDLAKKCNFMPSKLMIPLSYAAILGGTCTLIGTSTNLVVNGMMIKEGLPSMHLFDITPIGLPTALFGALYLIYIAPRLLPEHESTVRRFENPREYTVEMLVPKNSPLIGKTIVEAGLRHMPSLYLAEIIRGDETLIATPELHLTANDRLLFTGVVESVKELQNIRGLSPATDNIFKLDSPRFKRQLFEVVVSNTCPVVGKTVREGRFRSRYHAVVLAVARNDERIQKKIGDIVLKPGDTLLVEADPDFAIQYRDSRDFFLISALEDSAPRAHDRAWISMIILLVMVLAASFNVVDMLIAAMIAAFLMMITRCCTTNQARRSIEWTVLIVIAASLGVGEALEQSGAAQFLANWVVNSLSNDPFWALVAVYVVTVIVTEFITNNAAVALMFPIVISLVNQLDVHYFPYMIALMMAGSFGFATPFGYQTNLMVYGPGGYKFNDYIKAGMPLNFITGLCTILLLKWIYNL